MDKIIELDLELDTTEDCKNALETYKPGKWKRLKKFNIKLENDDTIVRTFTDGSETVSLITTENGSFLIKFDIDTIRPLIDKIQLVAKNYYSHDCSNIFINPWTMQLWVVGGDGGIIYSTTRVSYGVEMDDDKYQYLPDFSTFIPEISSTRFEGECFPPLLEEDLDDYYTEDKMEWIQVGNIINICNL